MLAYVERADEPVSGRYAEGRAALQKLQIVV
jgi:hypothetical protein